MIRRSGMMTLRGSGQASAILWDSNYGSRLRHSQRFNLLLRFCSYCGRTSDQLLQMREITAEKWLMRWIENFRGAKSTKLNYISIVRSFFAYHGRSIPRPPRPWIRGLKSDRPIVVGRLARKNFANMLEHCRADPRTRSMLLVQLQSLSRPRELCTIGNAMGPQLARKLRRGAKTVRLYFLRHGSYRLGFHDWTSFIGTGACDALRDWFAVRGWPNRGNPYVWPSRRSRRSGKQGPLTARSVTQLFSRLSALVKLRRKKRGTSGSWVRYGVSAKEVRHLAMALAYQATFMTKPGRSVYPEIIRYFAGYSIDEMLVRRHMTRPDIRFLRRQYRLIEPYLSPSKWSP
jgi:hypothetical protein